jgi:hypothetical protein
MAITQGDVVAYAIPALAQGDFETMGAMIAD